MGRRHVQHGCYRRKIRETAGSLHRSEPFFGTVYTARTQERRATTQHGARHADRIAWTQHEIGREWRTHLPTSTMKTAARIFAT